MAYFHDYSKWTSAERAFVMDNPALMAAYDAGDIKYKPGQMIYALASVEELATAEELGEITNEQMTQLYGLRLFGGNLEVWKHEELFQGITPTVFREWTAEWKQDYMDTYNQMIALGYKKSELDPTPWDEETAADKELRQQYLLDELATAEQEALAESERLQAEEEAAAQAAAQVQIDTDIDTMNKLASLRFNSETLATADVDEYIAKTSEYLKLRGVVPGFTDEVREELITSRFTDYWSQENEQNLVDLMTKYQGSTELPDVSERVWSKGGRTLTPPSTLLTTVQTVLASSGNSTVASLLSIYEEEDNKKLSLLGV